MMKPEEEIVTAKVTRKELESIAAKRWLRAQKKRVYGFLWLFLLALIAGLVVMFVDSPPGAPPNTHHIGKSLSMAIALALMAGGFIPLYYVSIRADRIGKDEAKKLIV